MIVHDLTPEYRSVAWQRGLGAVNAYEFHSSGPKIRTCGSVRSMWIRRTVTVAFWPLVVLIVRCTDRLLPLFDSRTGFGHAPARVPPRVLHVNVTVTGVVHQPLRPLGRLDESRAVISGREAGCPVAALGSVAGVGSADADAAAMTPAEPVRAIATTPATSGRRKLEVTHERTTYPQ